MFTGIISAIGKITEAKRQGDLQLAIACSFADELSLGESVACNGCCLTVTGKDRGHFTVTLSAETLSCTAPRWNLGDNINLERALKFGDRLDGHMVSGHVDGIATLKTIDISGDSHILALDAPADLAHFIAAKGSVTLDGVSLTVNKVENTRVWVNIIPHTWQNTTLGSRKSGDALNLEIDMMARYTERLLSTKN